MDRLVAAGVLASAVVLLVAGCGDSREAPPAGGSAQTASVGTPAESAAEGMSEQERAAVEVCRQVITSAGVMIRDYNAFMRKLNATQDYADIGDEKEWAVETLTTGAALIRDKMTDVPADLAATIEGFVVATGLLAEQVERKSMQALNRASRDWEERRTEALEACGAYLPALA